MAYLGNTPTTQSFIAGTDYFNGTGAQVAYTLSRSVNSVNDIEVVVNNVEQNPSSYSAAGTTLTFSAAPSSGTGNIYVRYLSTTLQSIGVGAGSVGTAQLQDSSVTNAKLATASVTVAKMANEGTTGQLLTSNGAGSPPSYQTAAASGGFTAGTLMLFQQTAAPTGWVKQTTHDNKALRVVSGTAGTGGAVAFTTAFAAGSTGATTLTTAQMPSHSHSITSLGSQSSCGGSDGGLVALNNAYSIGTTATGGGGSHTHSLALNVSYVDLIIASKS